MFKFNRDMLIRGDENFYDVWEPYYNNKYDTIRSLEGVEIIAEIGVRAGYGAKMLLEGCTHDEPRYIGFDSFNTKHHKGITNVALKQHSDELLRESGYAYSIHTINTRDIGSLKEFFPSGVDFFHIDGDHSHEGSYNDLELALEVLNPGGYILVDDVGEVQSNGKVLPIGTDIVRHSAESFRDKHTEIISDVREIKSLTGEWLICFK